MKKAFYDEIICHIMSSKYDLYSSTPEVRRRINLLQIAWEEEDQVSIEK